MVCVVLRLLFLSVQVNHCSDIYNNNRQEEPEDNGADVYGTLSWTGSEPHALVMFGKMSDHPADVQFLLMLPVREEEKQRDYLRTS